MERLLLIFGRAVCTVVAVMLAVNFGCRPAGAPAKPVIEAPVLGGLDPAVAQRLSADRHTVLARFDKDGLTLVEAGEIVGELGMVYHAWGFNGPALQCYRYSIDAHPDTTRWVYLLGRIEYDRGRWGEAAELLETSAGMDPLDVTAAFFAGAARQMGDESGRAIEWFHETLERDPTCAAAHFRMAQIEADRHNFTQAVEHYLRALDLQPGATRLHAALAALYRRLDDEDLAASHAALAGDGVVQLADPLMAEIGLLSVSVNEMVNRGSAAFSRKEYSEAHGWFKRASAIEPDNAMVHLNLGSALVGMGATDDALHEFETAILLEPADPRSHFNLGTLLAKSGNHAAAITEYRTAVGIDPRYAEAHVNLGNALLREGDYDAAAEHLLTANQIDGYRPGVRRAEVIALSMAGRWNRAVERMETAYRLFPEDQSIAGGLARLLATCPVDGLRDGQRAIEITESLIGKTSQLDVVETLAMAYAEAGRFEDAVQVQERALDAAKGAGRTDLGAVIDSNLVRFRRREPCRTPWSGTLF